MVFVVHIKLFHRDLVKQWSLRFPLRVLTWLVDGHQLWVLYLLHPLLNFQNEICLELALRLFLLLHGLLSLSLNQVCWWHWWGQQILIHFNFTLRLFEFGEHGLWSQSGVIQRFEPGLSVFENLIVGLPPLKDNFFDLREGLLVFIIEDLASYQRLIRFHVVLWPILLRWNEAALLNLVSGDPRRLFLKIRFFNLWGRCGEQGLLHFLVLQQESVRWFGEHPVFLNVILFHFLLDPLNFQLLFLAWLWKVLIRVKVLTGVFYFHVLILALWSEHGSRQLIHRNISWFLVKPLLSILNFQLNIADRYQFPQIRVQVLLFRWKIDGSSFHWFYY